MINAESKAVFGKLRTILNALVEQQVCPLLACLPPWSDAALGRDAIVELCENFEAVIKHVLLLLNC